MRNEIMEPLFFTPLMEAQFSSEKMNRVNLYESPQMFCDVYCLRPGQRQKEHTHADNDKVYYVTSGSCTIRIGENRQTVSAGQLAIAPAGVIHGVMNDSGEDTTILVIMAPNPNMQK
jgi:quercetin dioxygenase-like cupin family protein